VTVHCFDVVYSPSSQMDYFLESWLTSWTAWTEESVNNPGGITFSGFEYETEIQASGFQGNRFEWDDTGRAAREDAEFIASQLTGQVGYLASYCDWRVVRWHQCYHDDDKSCDDWQVLDSSDNYSGQEDVPSEVF